LNSVRQLRLQSSADQIETGKVGVEVSSTSPRAVAFFPKEFHFRGGKGTQFTRPEPQARDLAIVLPIPDLLPTDGSLTVSARYATQSPRPAAFDANFRRRPEGVMRGI